MAAMGLTGCGFQMVGTALWPESIATINIVADQQADRLAETLAKQVQTRGGALGQSDYRLHVVSAEQGRRVLSVARLGGPEEYELFQTTTFYVSGSDELKTLSVIQDIDYERTDVLSTERDVERLHEALRQDLAQQMLDQALHQWQGKAP